MNTFDKAEITNDIDLIGEKLKRARLKQEKTIAEVANDLSINLKYISSIESGDFDSLPPGLYKKNFLKEYSRYLKINPVPIISAFDAFEKERRSTKVDPFSKKVVNSKDLVSVPKIIKGVIIVLIIGACFTYIGSAFRKLTSEPKIEILFPPDNLTTDKMSIEIRGTTEYGTNIKINGETMIADSFGNFSSEISLKRGINNITISAKKNYGKEKTIEKQILVK